MHAVTYHEAETRRERARRVPLWKRLVVGSWIVVAGVLVGGAVIPHRQDIPYLSEEVAQEATGTPVTPVGPTPSPEARVYSWEPQKGAERYNVMFWQDGSMVRGEETAETSVRIALEPGEYQWVVMPIVNGTQVEAIVNSLVTVP